MLSLITIGVMATLHSFSSDDDATVVPASPFTTFGSLWFGIRAVADKVVLHGIYASFGMAFSLKGWMPVDLNPLMIFCGVIDFFNAFPKLLIN
jgi:hypothetical protein